MCYSKPGPKACVLDGGFNYSSRYTCGNMRFRLTKYLRILLISLVFSLFNWASSTLVIMLTISYYQHVLRHLVISRGPKSISLCRAFTCCFSCNMRARPITASGERARCSLWPSNLHLASGIHLASLSEATFVFWFEKKKNYYNLFFLLLLFSIPAVLVTGHRLHFVDAPHSFLNFFSIFGLI